jgi:hypothetical protein
MARLAPNAGQETGDNSEVHVEAVTGQHLRFRIHRCVWLSLSLLPKVQ